jgi:hypothetical protein
VEQFTQILRSATANLPAEFFILPVHGAEAVLRERVYCYELYHQMRGLWPNECPYRLNGEVDKRSHPYFHYGGEPKPDLLVHRPGTGDNYAVLEVKTCRVENRDIDKDLATLARFVELGYRYQRAVYLIYGPDTNTVSDRVRERAIRMGVPPFELWLHQAAGVAAEIQ